MLLTVESCFIINLWVLPSVLCGLRSLDATVRGQGLNPEAGGSCPGLWTIRGLPIPGNVSRQELALKQAGRFDVDEKLVSTNKYMA